MNEVVYGLARTWVMALLCFIVAAANLWMAQNGYHRKRWPKRIKALNWLILGSVYLADHIWEPAALDIRIYYRLALFLMMLGEVGYHADTLQDIAGVALSKVKRLLYG